VICRGWAERVGGPVGGRRRGPGRRGLLIPMGGSGVKLQKRSRKDFKIKDRWVAMGNRRVEYQAVAFRCSDCRGNQ
jgi:hypothetical protein